MQATSIGTDYVGWRILFMRILVARVVVGPEGFDNGVQVVATFNLVGGFTIRLAPTPSAAKSETNRQH
jgi:hypothetical protein